MKTFKKSLAALLAVMIVLSTVCVAAYAEGLTGIKLTARDGSSVTFTAEGAEPDGAVCVKAGSQLTGIPTAVWNAWAGSLSGAAFTVTGADIIAQYNEAALGDSYIIVARQKIEGTDDYNYVSSAAFNYCPKAPVISSRSTTSITVTAIEGCEFSIDNATWQNATTFDSLTPGTDYTIYARYKASGEIGASAVSSTATKTYLPAPGKADKPVLSTYTKDSITVVAVEGVEFSIDEGKTWQDSDTFKKLKKDTSYSIYARLKATDEQLPGEISEALIVRTATRSAYTADKSRCSLTIADEEVYTGKEFEFTAKGDYVTGAADDFVPGDTRLVPVSWVAADPDGKVIDAGSLKGTTSETASVKTENMPVERAQKKDVTVTVTFELQEYVGSTKTWNKMNSEDISKSITVTGSRNYLKIFATFFNVILQLFNKGFASIYQAVIGMLK